MIRENPASQGTEALAEQESRKMRRAAELCWCPPLRPAAACCCERAASGILADMPDISNTPKLVSGV